MSDNQSENSDYWLPQKAAMSDTPALPAPDCWAVLTPNGSRLVSPDEARGLHKAYPLFTADQLRAALAAQAEAQPCGHPKSLLLHSAETGAPLYCELCDDKSGRRDAEQRERELQAELARLTSERDALRAFVADDSRAISYQSIGQYRNALLAAIDAARAQGGTPT